MSRKSRRQRHQRFITMLTTACNDYLQAKGISIKNSSYQEMVLPLESLAKITPPDPGTPYSSLRTRVIVAALTLRLIPLSRISKRIREGIPVLPRTRAEDKRGFFASLSWKKLRYDTLVRYGPSCQACGSKKHIQVDHIKPVSRYWELRLDPENVQVLCAACNMGKLNRDETDWRQKAGAQVSTWSRFKSLPNFSNPELATRRAARFPDLSYWRTAAKSKRRRGWAGSSRSAVVMSSMRSEITSNRS